MARIIYKEGCEGQNTLKSIEGIEIDLLNGQKALIYPKYAERQMLTDDKIASWDAKEIHEIEALKEKDNQWATGALLKCGSPVAKHVSNFRSDKHGIFGLPTLLAAMELQYQKDDIDALAETIKGAHLLRDFTIHVWTCSRYRKSGGWVANGHYDFAYDKNVYYSFLAVPVILY